VCVFNINFEGKDIYKNCLFMILKNEPLFYKLELIIISDDLFIILTKLLFDIYLGAFAII